LSPTGYRLSPIAPIAYRLSPIAPIAYRLSPIAYRLYGDGVQAALEAARAGADVFFVLVAEILDRADDGTGGEFAEGAQTLAGNVVADVEQQLEVFRAA